MKDFFYAIQDFGEPVVGAGGGGGGAGVVEIWFGANIVSWIFMSIGLVAFVYWMLQLKSFSDNNEEDKSISSHSYL